jgi:hypothetical protein
MLNYQWNQGVITYDLGRQFDLLQQGRGGIRKLRLELPLRVVWPWLLGGALLGGGCWLFWRHWQWRVEERLLHKFLRTVARRYHRSVAENVGLQALAEELDDDACRQFAAIYGGALYRDRRLSRTEIGQLRRLIRRVGKG